MSSFARRSVRISAAAAGIAALGLGIAGTAFASPSLPELPELPGTGAASTSDLPGIASFSTVTDAVTQAADTISNLPDAFAFDLPQTLTDPSSIVDSASISSLAAPEGILTMHGGLAGIHPDLDPTSFLGTNDVSGLPSADTLTGLVHGSLLGSNSMTSGNDYGNTDD